jgi:hypothetical protein
MGQRYALVCSGSGLLSPLFSVSCSSEEKYESLLSCPCPTSSLGEMEKTRRARHTCCRFDRPGVGLSSTSLRFLGLCDCNFLLLRASSSSFSRFLFAMKRSCCSSRCVSRIGLETKSSALTNPLLAGVHGIPREIVSVVPFDMFPKSLDEDIRINTRRLDPSDMFQ